MKKRIFIIITVSLLVFPLVACAKDNNIAGSTEPQAIADGFTAEGEVAQEGAAISQKNITGSAISNKEAQGSVVKDNNKRVYVLDTGGREVLLDHSGKELLVGNDLEILGKWETKEQFYVIDRRIFSKRGQEPIYSEALYALDGSLLIDYDNVRYEAVTDGYVLCYEQFYEDDDYMGYFSDGEKYLLDLRTMQKVRLPDNVYYFNVLWSKYLAYWDYDTDYIKILDFSGKEVFSLENAKTMPVEWNDFLVIRAGQDYVGYVLDRNFKVVYSDNNIRFPEEFNAVFTQEALIINDFAINSKGEMLGDCSWFSRERNIIYFDDDIALVESTNFSYYEHALKSRSGAFLTEAFSNIIKLPYEAGKAEKFVAIEDKAIVTIGRDGATVVRDDDKSYWRLNAMPGDRILCLYDGDDAEYHEDGWRMWTSSSGAKIIDKKGSVLADIPPDPMPGTRTDFELTGAELPSIDWRGRNPDGPYCLSVQRYKKDTWMPFATDIYDLDANLIIKNVTAVHDVDKDRILLTYGFSVGMMDYSGNWLYKTSAFELLEE